MFEKSNKRKYAKTNNKRCFKAYDELMKEE